MAYYRWIWHNSCLRSKARLIPGYKGQLKSKPSFFLRLNPIVLLFDPHLHTFDYVREKSAFLWVPQPRITYLTEPDGSFTSMLSSASKFIAPSLSSQLLRLSIEHSVHAIFASHRSIEDVQSWMLVYFWKTPRDNRAWTYVGLVSHAHAVPYSDLSNFPTDLPRCARDWSGSHASCR